MTQKVFAPAKVNLALHVTGKRADGYHLLDSLVVFAGVYDRIDIAPAEQISLSVTGPMAGGVPSDQSNLVWKAAEFAGKPSQLSLQKNLPSAAGIGSASSDAAAVLVALGAGPEGSESLGADVPVCWHRTPCRMTGIGEVRAEVPDLPMMWMVLVNAGEPVPTGAVFQALERVDNGVMPDPAWHDFASMIAWLKGTRNDLEAPARGISPTIDDVLTRLRATDGCAFARMSGSGGTCFGLYETKKAAAAAASAMPDAWWAQDAPVLRR
jgi:4-diphosphocytidyl-2-C-methyl-D-erythritol kinase